MEQNTFKIHKGELIGIILTITGFIITISAKSFGATEGFWNIYTTGFIVTGLTILGIGLLLAVLSILKLRTSFLDLKQGIDAGKLGIVLAVSIITVIIVNALVIPRLPNKSEKEIRKLPPKMASDIRKNEDNFKVFFSLSIIVAGIAVCTIPSVKFLKN